MGRYTATGEQRPPQTKKSRRIIRHPLCWMGHFRSSQLRLMRYREMLDHCLTPISWPLSEPWRCLIRSNYPIQNDTNEEKRAIEECRCYDMSRTWELGFKQPGKRPHGSSYSVTSVPYLSLSCHKPGRRSPCRYPRLDLYPVQYPHLLKRGTKDFNHSHYLQWHA